MNDDMIEGDDDDGGGDGDCGLDYLEDDLSLQILQKGKKYYGMKYETRSSWLNCAL